MDIAPIIRSQMMIINDVDDIFELIKNQINLKIFEPAGCDQKFKQLCETRKELQNQINICKCDFVSQENEDLLVELCYKYLELFFGVLHLDKIRTNKIVAKSNVDATFVQCWICHSELKPGEERCCICDEPVNSSLSIVEKNRMKNNEMRKSVGAEGGDDNINRKDQQQINREIKSQLHNYQNLEEENVEKSKSTDPKKDLTEMNPVDNKKNLEIYEILSKTPEKWFCAVCTFLNTFNSVICVVCTSHMENNGFWICAHCLYLNRNPFVRCSVCLEVNANFQENLYVNISKPDQANSEKDSFKKINNKSEDEKKMKFKRENWTCWYTLCGKSNSEKDIFFCKHCRLARNPPRSDSDSVLRCYENGKFPVNVWICSKCVCVNNMEDRKCGNKKCGEFRFQDPVQSKDQMKNEMTSEEIWNCEKCESINNKEDGKCQKCAFQKSDVIVISGGWMCWNTKCKQVNNLHLDFCQHCKLTKHSLSKHQDHVKCKDKNGIKDIWVCRLCFKFNDINDYKCMGRKCGADRFVINKL